MLTYGPPKARRGISKLSKITEYISYAGIQSKDVATGDKLRRHSSGRRPKSDLVEQHAGGGGPVRDPVALLQEMDVNRLRAVIYRDVVRF